VLYDREKIKVVAILTLWLLFVWLALIHLLSARDDKYLQFYIGQGLQSKYFWQPITSILSISKPVKKKM